MDQHTLEAVGLTRNEARIYLALLRGEKMTASSLASKVGLHRRTVYDCVRRLQEKGLVGSVIEGRKTFLMSYEPDKLLDYLREEEESIHSRMEEVRAILPSLQQLAKSREGMPKVALFRGKEGIKSILEGVIRSGMKRWYAFMSGGFGHVLLSSYLPHFHKRRIAAGIRFDVLAAAKGASLQRAAELSAMRLTTVRLLPETFITPISIWVYGPHVVFVLWEAQVAILIDDRNSAESFKSYFDLLWGIAKPFRKG